MRGLLRSIRRMVRPDDFRPSAGFVAAVAKLKPGDICIDCGANVGSYTQFLAKHGAEVFAFEPDPVAFACLERRFGASPGIHLSAAAVGTADGKEKLFMHGQYEDDPVHYSQGSSLAVSAQLDMPTEDVAALIAEARQAALETIDRYDVRLSLSASLEDIAMARREALRALNTNASPSARASARRMLLTCAQAEADLAVLIENYRNAKGLDGSPDEGPDTRSVEFWLRKDAK